MSCVEGGQDTDDLDCQPLAVRRNRLSAVSQRPTSEVASAAVGPAESHRNCGATPLSCAESASPYLSTMNPHHLHLVRKQFPPTVNY